MEKETRNPLVKEAINKLHEIQAKNGVIFMATERGKIKTKETFADIISPLPEALAQEVWFSLEKEDLTPLGIDDKPKEDVLSQREEINLFIKAKNGDLEARNEFLAKNDRLIYKEVFAHLDRGFDFEDLEQEGRVGLIVAYNRFDWKRGFKFSTHAYWWIKQQIGRTLSNKGEAIRHPVNFIRDFGKLRKIENLLVNKLKRVPTDFELAEEVNFHPEKVRYLKENLRQVESLDEPVRGKDEGLVKIETIADEKPGPDDLSEWESDKRYIFSLMEKAGLSPVEKRVWILYHLNEGARHLSYVEIGKKLGFKRQRAKEAEKKATRKLREFFFKDNPEKAVGFMKYLFGNSKIDRVR